MKTIALSILAMIVLLSSSINSKAQQASIKPEIRVIQFHSEHRCKTCVAIEKHTTKALNDFKGLKLEAINVDQKKNAAFAEKFEATGTALFLYDPKSGKKKDLTSFAFMNAGNEQKFNEGLNKEIKTFYNELQP